MDRIIGRDRDELTLEGFDELESPLGAVVESWEESHSEVSGQETITLLAEHDLDQDGKEWAASANIGSITFAPIRVADGKNLATIATLLLTTSQALSKEKICLVNSLFRRLLQQIQNILELARVHESSGQNSKWP